MCDVCLCTKYYCCTHARTTPSDFTGYLVWNFWKSGIARYVVAACQHGRHCCCLVCAVVASTHVGAAVVVVCTHHVGVNQHGFSSYAYSSIRSIMPSTSVSTSHFVFRITTCSVKFSPVIRTGRGSRATKLLCKLVLLYTAVLHLPPANGRSAAENFQQEYQLLKYYQGCRGGRCQPQASYIRCCCTAVVTAVAVGC